MITKRVQENYGLSGLGNSLSGSSMRNSQVNQNYQNVELVTAVKELNRQLKNGIKANAYINKYGRNGLDDAISDISKFKKQVYKS